MEPNDRVPSGRLKRGVDNYRSFAKLCVTLAPDSGGSELTRLNGYLDRGDAGVRRALTLMGVQVPPR